MKSGFKRKGAKPQRVTLVLLPTLAMTAGVLWLLIGTGFCMKGLLCLSCSLAAVGLLVMSCDSRSSIEKQLADALKSGDTNSLKRYLDSGGSVDQVIQTYPLEKRSREPLLHAAIFFGQPEAVRFLLTNGAAPYQKNPEGHTAIEMALASWRSEAPISERIQILKMLLQAGVSPDSGTNSEFWTPLCLASALGETDALSILLEAGADVNGINKAGMTALHLAENAAVAKMLLAAGANPTARTLGGKTPADTAADSKRFSVLEVLTNKPAH